MSVHVTIEQPSEADIDAVRAVLAEAYWSPGIPRDVVACACANSMCAIARDEQGALVGFARAVTDKATFAWLCDVFVSPAHQGGGVARALVRVFLEHSELQGLRRWLLSTRDGHGVYAPLGFMPLEAPERFMQIRHPALYGVARS